MRNRFSVAQAEAHASTMTQAKLKSSVQLLRTQEEVNDALMSEKNPAPASPPALALAANNCYCQQLLLLRRLLRLRR